MKRAAIAMLMLGMTVLGVALGILVGTAGGSSTWKCGENRGVEIMSYSEDAGYSSEVEAMEAWIPSISSDTGVARAALSDAMASEAGPDRFEADTKELFVNGQIVARFTPAQTENGKYWTMSKIETCFEGSDERPDAESPSA